MLTLLLNLLIHADNAADLVPDAADRARALRAAADLYTSQECWGNDIEKLKAKLEHWKAAAHR